MIVDKPSPIGDEERLLDLLTEPDELLLRDITRLNSPLVILGAGGKMGPTLAVLARRASEAAGRPIEVVAVSRFSDDAARGWLEKRGVRTVSCDLLDRDALAKLPDAKEIVYLVGYKFGTEANPCLTWAMNTVVPIHAAERYPQARFSALSTGNVYPFVPVESGGAREEDPLTPLGEYPNAAVARERLFGYFSARNKTPVVLLRLNYAVELRYGVLHDLAQRVWRDEEIPLETGWFNCIWQRDANSMILRSLLLTSSPPLVLNLTGKKVCSVREVANRFGALLGKQPRFSGAESDSALISNTERAQRLLGEPRTDMEHVMEWVADWIRQSGRSLNKPTHFEVRDGRY